MKVSEASLQLGLSISLRICFYTHYTGNSVSRTFFRPLDTKNNHTYWYGSDPILKTLYRKVLRFKRRRLIDIIHFTNREKEMDIERVIII